MSYFLVYFIVGLALIIGYVFGQAMGKARMIAALMLHVADDPKLKRELLDTLGMIAKGEG